MSISIPLRRLVNVNDLVWWKDPADHTLWAEVKFDILVVPISESRQLVSTSFTSDAK